MRAPRRRSALAAALAAVALAAAVAPAAVQAQPAGSVTASGGPVRATLSWQEAELGVADPRLVVERDGAPALSGSPFAAGSGCAEPAAGCSLLPSGRRRSALQVLDVDADGEPEVLVDAFTGGAHCCAETVVWRRGADGAYAARELEWGNGGYDVRRLDADPQPELVTQDDRFAAVFTAYAASYPPVRVVHFDASKRSGLVSVTRRFPALVRSDLRTIRRTIRRERRRSEFDLRGLVAAEVADLYTLRQPRSAVRTLDAHIHRGDAGSRAQARSFRRALLRFLHRTGYR
jgi:hypothetical protein